MNKSAFICLSAGLALLCLAAPLSAAEVTTCTVNGDGKITDTTNCYTQPDEYYMTIYKVGLCTQQPAAPTATTPLDTSSCTTVFESTAGSSVAVQKGVLTPVAGTITRPPNGTYAYGYIVSSPKFMVRITKAFEPARTAVGGGGGTGPLCWSKTGDQYIYSSAISGMPADCGTTATTLGTATFHMNSLTPISDGAPTYSAAVGGGTTIHLATSTLTLASGSADQSNGTVARFIGIAAMPVTVSDSTTGIDTAFSVSRGATVVFTSAGGAPAGSLLFFGNGPFSIDMSLK